VWARKMGFWLIIGGLLLHCSCINHGLLMEY
jgi:hypothetical protein